MEIRKGTIADAPILEKLFSVLYKPNQKWSEEKIREEIKTGEKEYYLAVDNTKIIAAFGIKIDNSTAKLGPIVVKKEHHQKGVGSIFLAFAEKLAKKQGLNKIWCYSLERYAVSRFYECNGWEKERFIKDFWDGQNCFVYMKNIN